MSGTLGDRVRELRIRRGWSLQDLADDSGLSKMQVHRIETGVRKKLSTAEISALGNSLGVTPAGLLGDERPVRRVSTVAARLVSEEVPANVTTAVNRAGELLDLSAKWPQHAGAQPKVTRWWGLPARNQLEKDRGTRLARQLRDQLGLADEPIDDLQLLCESEFGLAIALEPLPKKLRGLLVAVSGEDEQSSAPQQDLQLFEEDNADGEEADDMATVPLTEPVEGLALVDTARQERGGQRFTMAHELGHYLFRDFDGRLLQFDPEADSARSSGPGRWAELRCDCFAAELLAPAKGILAMAESRDLSQLDAALTFVAEVALTYGVSWDAARRRVQSVCPERVKSHALHRARRNETLDRLNLRQRWDEANPSEAVVPPVYYQAAALAAYAAGDISVYELGRLYGTSDLHSFQQSLEAAGWAPPST